MCIAFTTRHQTSDYKSILSFASENNFKLKVLGISIRLRTTIIVFIFAFFFLNLKSRTTNYLTTANKLRENFTEILSNKHNL